MQTEEEPTIFKDSNADVNLNSYFYSKNTQCGKEEKNKFKSQDSDWVDLIINPNEEDSDDKENIETNILLKSSIKRLTASKLAQEQEDNNDNQSQYPLKSAFKRNGTDSMGTTN